VTSTHRAIPSVRFSYIKRSEVAYVFGWGRGYAPDPAWALSQTLSVPNPLWGALTLYSKLRRRIPLFILFLPQCMRAASQRPVRFLWIWSPGNATVRSNGPHHLCYACNATWTTWASNDIINTSYGLLHTIRGMLYSNVTPATITFLTSYCNLHGRGLADIVQDTRYTQFTNLAQSEQSAHGFRQLLWKCSDFRFFAGDSLESSRIQFTRESFVRSGLAVWITHYGCRVVHSSNKRL